jgi:N6-adenosine-specific RNA methylase IME4
VRSIIEGQLREHSRKPDEAYAAAERMYPSARKASLFERPIRPGWEGWGDQYGLPITSKKDTAPETVVAGQADLFAEAAQ